MGHRSLYFAVCTYVRCSCEARSVQTDEAIDVREVNYKRARCEYA